MSLHDLPPARKPRRLGLYAPFILLLVAIVAWSGFWFYARAQAQSRMDGYVAALKQAGYVVTWRDRVLGGHPGAAA
jgi:hypothetical protein